MQSQEAQPAAALQAGVGDRRFVAAAGLTSAKLAPVKKVFFSRAGRLSEAGAKLLAQYPIMPIAENMTMAIHARIFHGTWLRAGAEQAAPYEFTSAVEYLNKAEEEGSQAEYQVAIEYGRRSEDLARRALATETWDEFGLGFAPPGREVFLAAMQGLGLAEDALVDAGPGK